MPYLLLDVDFDDRGIHTIHLYPFILTKWYIQGDLNFGTEENLIDKLPGMLLKCIVKKEMVPSGSEGRPKYALRIQPVSLEGILS